LAKAGGNGRLFGTVTNANVAEAIATALNVAIDRHKIEMKDGIKAVGTYPIEVRLGNNVIAKSNIRVVAAK
jgi:large subunit ribosomal protein L9